MKRHHRQNCIKLKWSILQKISKRKHEKLVVSLVVTKWVKPNANKTICQTKNHPWNWKQKPKLFQSQVTILHADTIPIITN